MKKQDAKPLEYGHHWLDETDIEAVTRVLKGEFITQGPANAQFEKAICDYTGAKYSVACSNGTAALHLAVLASGAQPGDEGITSPITFVASSNCMIYSGIRPLFADIDPRTYNIDPEQVRKHLNPKTKLLIPVHFAGQPADMDALKDLCKDKNITIIEDAAHAIGSRDAQGAPIGSCRCSHMTIFSFHPVKTMTTGEGGMVTTNDKSIYEKLLMLRSHGITKSPDKLHQKDGPWYYEMQELGFNYRLTDIQAALGLSQLNRLENFVERRREIVAIYNDCFKDIDWLHTPYEDPSVFSAFHLYIALIDFDKIGCPRVDFMTELRNRSIGTQVHYIPVYTQPYYQEHYGLRCGECPEAEKYYKQTLSLPLFPQMTDDDVHRVVDTIQNIGESKRNR